MAVYVWSNQTTLRVRALSGKTDADSAMNKSLLMPVPTFHSSLLLTAKERCRKATYGLPKIVLDRSLVFALIFTIVQSGSDIICILLG